MDPALQLPTLQSSTNHSSLLFDSELTFTLQYVDGQEEPRWQNANVNSLVKILLTVQPFVSRDVQFCTEQTQYIIERLPSSLKWKNIFSSFTKVHSAMFVRVFSSFFVTCRLSPSNLVKTTNLEYQSCGQSFFLMKFDYVFFYF